MPNFELIRIVKRFKIIPSLYLGIKGCFKINYCSFPDSVYGEWIIYQKSMPAYYFSAFNQDSIKSDRLIEYAKKNSLEFETFLAKLLRKKGYKNINSVCKNSILIHYYKKSYIADIPLLQIVDG